MRADGMRPYKYELCDFERYDRITLENREFVRKIVFIFVGEDIILPRIRIRIDVSG